MRAGSALVLLALVSAPLAAADSRVADVAARHGLPVRLVEAVVAIESAGNPSAVSPKGAMGLMQLMPATAARFGVTDPFDAEESLEGGCAYLRWLLDRFDGSVALALAGYNAGEGAVERHGGIPPFEETRAYVRSVLARLGPSARTRSAASSFASLASAGAATSIVVEGKEGDQR